MEELTEYLVAQSTQNSYKLRYTTTNADAHRIVHNVLPIAYMQQ